MTRTLSIRLTTAAAVLAAAVGAFAHGGSGVIDIETIDARVDARLELTFGKEHRAYVALARVIRRPNAKKSLALDVGKLLAVARACAEGPLAADTVLRDGLPAPEAQTDAFLASQPSLISEASKRLERAADRAKVKAASDAAAAAHADGVALRGAGDELGMLAAYRRAAAGFERANQLAGSLLKKQIRRGAPGQPVRKGAKGTIDTYAGSGLLVSTPDGTSALDFSFYFPMDAAVDPGTGLLHVVDYNNHKIRVIDETGKVRTLLRSSLLPSSGPGLVAPMDHPSGVAFDPLTDDLVVAGWHGQSILRVDAARTAVTVVAGGTAGDAGDDGPAAAALLDYPSSVAFDAQGGWYVSDQFNDRIRYVDPSGVIHAFAGTGTAGFAGDDGPALAAQFAFPADAAGAPAGCVALSPDGSALYVADTSNHRVRRIDVAARTISTFAGDGRDGGGGDGLAATSASLSEPVDVDCDAAGNVFVCDRGRSVVRRIDAVTKIISTVAGVDGASGYSGDGHAATSARLRQPSGLCVDRVRGRVYVADTGNSVIRVIWE